MSDIFDGILKQLIAILDVSGVPPIFGIKGLLAVFIILEIGVYIYMKRASRIFLGNFTGYRQNMTRNYWIKFVLLFLLIRPLCMAVNPESGRFQVFVWNIVSNGILVVVALLRERYLNAEEARFEDWSELNAGEKSN
jgi:hypothetical protein